MSSAPSAASYSVMQQPDWFIKLLGLSGPPQDGDSLTINDKKLIFTDGVFRHHALISAAQKQTEDTFGYKWSRRETFESSLPEQMRRWLIEKYGDLSSNWFTAHQPNPIILDAGCGAALSGLALFGPALDNIRYIGVDVSPAVDVARARFHERGANGGFIQSDLQQIPLGKETVDIIFSEGVLHHTDSTANALATLIPHLKCGGHIMFYVYRKKGPVREFTDDHIRDRLQSMSPQDAWNAIVPLTKLGIALGDLNAEIDIPEDVEVLGIPAGRINVQRLFYWHVLKAFYRTDITFDEMQHINFDWYAPKNAHRQTLEEVQGWCRDLGLAIEHEREEFAGITIVAKKL